MAAAKIPKSIDLTRSKTQKIHRKNPVKQYRHQAKAKRTELSDLIRVNKTREPQPHRRSATLSKREACDLVGRNKNKGISCISVSQKRKQPHAVKSGRHYRRLKTVQKCYKSYKTEVSLSEKTLERTHCLKLVKINLLGHEITPYRAPNKTKLSRFLNKDKVRLIQIAKHSTLVKKNRILTYSGSSGSKMSKDRVKFPTSAFAQKMKLKTENYTPCVGCVKNSKTTKKIVQRPL